MSATWPQRNSTVFPRINTIQSIILSICTVQIVEKFSVKLFQNQLQFLSLCRLEHLAMALRLTVLLVSLLLSTPAVIFWLLW